MPQPKVGKNSCFVLRTRVAVDQGVGTHNPQEEKRNLLMRAPKWGRLVWMGEIYRRVSHKFCRLPAKELCDCVRTVEPRGLWCE